MPMGLVHIGAAGVGRSHRTRFLDRDNDLALAGAGGLLISLLADRRPATAEWIMNIDADRSEPMPSAPRGAGRVLALAAVACLVGAGLLLWARSGDAIFSDLVLSALAWCF